jgi:hypothetical protein
VAELLSSGVSVVVLPTLAALHPVPARALGLLGALLGAGLRVVSPADGWMAAVDAQTVSAVASHLLNDEARRNSQRGRSVIAAIRATGQRKVGRPSKPVNVVEARRLVDAHGYRKAARLMGNTSASSIRRALLKAETTH